MSRLNHTSSWTERTAILLTRLSVLWLLAFLHLSIPWSGTTAAASTGIALSIAIPYSLRLRSRLQERAPASQQFLPDLALAAVLLWRTGGIDSRLIMLYALVILAAGMVSPPRQAVRFTLLGVLVYLFIGAVQRQAVPADPAGAGSVPVLIGTRILLLAFFGSAGMYIASCCRYLSRADRAPGRILRHAFNQLGAGILILDRRGFILSANEAAARMLQTGPDRLLHRPFSDLCVPGLRALSDAYGPTVWLERGDAPPLPAALCRTDAELPASAIPGMENKEGNTAVTLLVLTDLTRAIELERRLDQAERVKAAARMAGEMAHDIRTPLTTLSASVQLLQHYENQSRSAEPPPDSPRHADRMELFEHILTASEKMDTVIRNFADFAEFSADDLLSIIKLDYKDENQGYIGHLNTRL